MGKESAVAEVYQERDGEEIAAEVYAEMDGAEKGEVKTPEKTSTPKKDDVKDGQPDDKPEEQAEGAEEAGEGAEGSEDKADDGSEEKKPEDVKEGVSEDLDKRITEHAEKHRMTYAEAKEDIEKTEEIIKQYKNDPAEMARAMRNKDREYHKLRSEIEKKEQKKEPLFRRMTDDQFREFARKKVAEAPEYIQKYREKFPAKSEAMSDDAIIEEVVERELMIYVDKASQKEREIKDTAAKKRDELIASIAEADRRFIPEIKAVLLEADDHAVLSDGFDIKDALYWAKGKAYDADIKAAEERAMKRLKETPEILGAKGGGTSKPSSGEKSVGLTKRQKSRALEMFGDDETSEEKCFKMFKETYAEELKKNANFDPYAD